MEQLRWPGRSIVMSVSICVFVSVGEHISGFMRPISTIFLHVIWPFGPPSRRRCDYVVLPILWVTLYVVFADSGPCESMSIPLQLAGSDVIASSCAE